MDMKDLSLDIAREAVAVAKVLAAESGFEFDSSEAETKLTLIMLAFEALKVNTSRVTQKTN